MPRAQHYLFETAQNPPLAVLPVSALPCQLAAATADLQTQLAAAARPLTAALAVLQGAALTEMNVFHSSKLRESAHLPLLRFGQHNIIQLSHMLGTLSTQHMGSQSQQLCCCPGQPGNGRCIASRSAPHPAWQQQPSPSMPPGRQGLGWV